MHTIDREGYDAIYRLTFGKGAEREACQQGWERCQAIWSSGNDTLVLHEPGTPVPVAMSSDYFVFAMCGPLAFVARASAGLFPKLAPMWPQFADRVELTKTLGPEARTAARAFVQNSLVDGHGMDLSIGTLMATAIMWLLAGNPLGLGIDRLRSYRYVGYDITLVPGPPSQARSFNFRVKLNNEKPEPAAALRSLPPSEWRPPRRK
jgi:hypothetical protein